MQGGFSYQASVFNRATQAQRQPGSSFKPFVYAAALENGYLPNTIVLDAPVALEQVSGEIWKPKNYSGRFYGPKPMRFGIELSQNLMTIRLAQDFGMDKVADYAEQFGVYAEMPQQLSYSLGAGETTLMKMVASYAMFANGGKRIEPTLIDRIQDRHGETTFRHDERLCLDCRQEEWSAQPEPYVPDEGEQVMNPATAYQVVSMMNGVTVRGTASKLSKNLDFPVAGKTGTTNESRDAWFIGFSADLVVGCFIGYDNPRPMGKGGTGGALCAPVFERVMAAAQEGKEPRDFRKPRSIVLQKINRQNGRCVPADWSGPDYILEAFRAGDQPCQSRRTIGGGDDSFFQATQDAAREGDLPPADAADPAPTADEELVFPAGQDAGRPRPPRPTFQGGDLGRGELY
ncbi:MAG: penicillin-binding transpeptidase domain-containing protein [Pseudomonadota bacterium]